MFKGRLYIAFLIEILITSCSIMNTGSELIGAVTIMEAHTFVVKKDINLHSNTLVFAKECKVIFSGGSIRNGKIVFNSTQLIGPVKFIDCQYEGRIKVESIDDRNFSSTDDLSTLQFLLDNAISNGVRCDFYRDYRINMNKASPNGLVCFQEFSSGSEISFHNHTIYNTTPLSSARIQPLIALRNVKNITIRNCRFHDSDKHNARLFSKSCGITFIHCLGDCTSINLLDCFQENGDCILRSGVYVHNFNKPEDTPFKGLSNSTLRVKSLNTSFGLALYCGDNLNIDINTYSPHRGFYCSGVSNSTINYKGYNPVETKCHILIKDAVYKREDGTIDMKGCHDLKINVVLDNALPNESIIVFHTYGSGQNDGADFTFRSEKCCHYNIDISADILKGSDSDYFVVSRFLPDSGNEDIRKYGNVVKQIRIHDVKCHTGVSRPYMCIIWPNVEADITVENCSASEYNESKGLGFDYLVKGNSKGRVSINNSAIGYIMVQEKKGGKFDFDVFGKPFTRDLNYLDDISSHKLVRLKKE